MGSRRRRFCLVGRFPTSKRRRRAEKEREEEEPGGRDQWQLIPSPTLRRQAEEAEAEEERNLQKDLPQEPRKVDLRRPPTRRKGVGPLLQRNCVSRDSLEFKLSWVGLGVLLLVLRQMSSSLSRAR